MEEDMNAEQDENMIIEKEVIGKMNCIKSTNELYHYITQMFIFYGNIDFDSELFEKLDDIHMDIDTRWPDYTEEKIDTMILEMKDIINEAHKNGTLNYIANPEED